MSTPLFTNQAAIEFSAAPTATPCLRPASPRQSGFVHPAFESRLKGGCEQFHEKGTTFARFHRDLRLDQSRRAPAVLVRLADLRRRLGLTRQGRDRQCALLARSGELHARVARVARL